MQVSCRSRNIPPPPHKQIAAALITHKRRLIVTAGNSELSAFNYLHRCGRFECKMMRNITNEAFCDVTDTDLHQFLLIISENSVLTVYVQIFIIYINMIYVCVCIISLSIYLTDFLVANFIVQFIRFDYFIDNCFMLFN